LIIFRAVVMNIITIMNTIMIFITIILHNHQMIMIYITHVLLQSMSGYTDDISYILVVMIIKAVKSKPVVHGVYVTVNDTAGILAS